MYSTHNADCPLMNLSLYLWLLHYRYWHFGVYTVSALVCSSQNALELRHSAQLNSAKSKVITNFWNHIYMGLLKVLSLGHTNPSLKSYLAIIEKGLAHCIKISYKRAWNWRVHDIFWRVPLQRRRRTPHFEYTAPSATVQNESGQRTTAALCYLRRCSSSPRIMQCINQVFTYWWCWSSRSSDSWVTCDGKYHLEPYFSCKC